MASYGDHYTIKCVGCGGQFTFPKPKGSPRKRCDECNIARRKELKNAAPGRKAAKARRRMKTCGEDVERFRSDYVFRRDGWACWLCGLPTLRENFSGYVSDQPTLDHVIPLAKGGSHTLSNVRTAHQSCNSIKSDRILEASQCLSTNATLSLQAA